jgi:hypothetical protein
MTIIISVLIGGAVLIAYCLIEKRINQQACPVCGFTRSVDATDDQCPRCDGIISHNTDV